MKEIRTERLLLRLFRESDYDDLFEFLSQLEDDEFEGYPGITYENGRKYLQQRLDSEEFYAVEMTGSGKVIGNVYCGSRDYEAKEVGYIINRNYRRAGYAEKAGLQREAHFRQNIWFRRDENGRPVWKDTYVYAKLNGISVRGLSTEGEKTDNGIRFMPTK